MPCSRGSVWPIGPAGPIPHACGVKAELFGRGGRSAFAPLQKRLTVSYIETKFLYNEPQPDAKFMSDASRDTEIAPSSKRPSLLEILGMREYTRFYIDGQWVDPEVSNPLEVINPADESVAGRISLGSAADVDKAVKAARKAFAAWSQTTPEEQIGRASCRERV